MNKPALFSPGFTLIELLVSILVVSILVGLGYTNFRRYSQKQSVWSVARQIEGDLRKAQSYAMAGKGSCSSGAYLLGYQFRWESNTSYLIRGICRSGEGSNSYINLSTIPIPSSFTISNFNGSLDPYGLNGVVFYSPKGNTNLESDREITVSLVSGSSTVYSARVIVSPGGKISISE